MGWALMDGKCAQGLKKKNAIVGTFEDRGDVCL